ncbi:metallophosphoesterase family protein [Caulifigura coniformis]|uniref:metallophosphoesterase family protein n=1 Tax=Caulifigura coniformis TaxID=2527983 RepID=UPI0011A20BB6
MVRAVISDIHGNLEALEAVLSDISSQGIKEIYCLGDVIGYGPNPRECIDLVMKNCQVTILGNHDQAALFDPEGFNAAAERSIFWTRHMLESGPGNERRWEYLGELPRMRKEEQFLFVHGSARNPLNEYVFPEDIYNQRKMERIFGLVEHYCFQGHTHIPGVFTEESTFQSPDEFDYRYEFTDRKTLVNVGSVGQPRDTDNRACYVVIHPNMASAVKAAASGPGGSDLADTPPAGTATVGASAGGPVIQYRRIPYDFEKTIAKIYAIPELDNFLGDRLRDGR